MSMLEKFLAKAAQGAGKVKGGAQWAMKEHPMATGAALGGAGTAMALGDDDGDEDDMGGEEESKLKMLLAKLGI